MIEGLKVTIAGTELKALCLSRSEFHQQRSETYRMQLTSMEANQIEGMQYSNGDPKKALQDRLDIHDNEASELRFIAHHLVDSESYLLGRDDLQKLGITRSRW